jgi:hypothetical protein
MKRRAEYLKAEIQKFLRDKKLLRELQENDHNSSQSGVSRASNAFSLLKEEIYNRSG